MLPFELIELEKFDKTKFKEFKYHVDDDYPECEFTLYIDNLKFIELP